MKTTIAAVALLCGGLLASTCAMADTDSFSVGYTWLKAQYEKGLNGFSLGYQHEFVNGWGILTSFAWATGDRSETDDVASGKFKYWSLMTGPTYRFNDYFGIYGQLGLAHFNGKGDAHYDDGDYEHWSESRSALGWGAGVIINPVENLSVTVGYQGTRFSLGDDEYEDKANVSVNGFNIGVGYRF
ncbi:outer membrane beta-barrel protein [Salmonella enterica]|nr:outer membrane beta-barrel protein [Salmonella enterica]